MATFKVHWRALILIGFILFEILLAIFYPLYSLSPKQNVRRSRNLMASKDANLGEYVRHLQRQLQVVRLHSDYQIQQLQERNRELKMQVGLQKQTAKTMETRNLQLIERMEEVQAGGHRRKHLEDRLAPRVTLIDLRTLNIRLSSEYEMLYYTLFDKDSLYSLDSGANNKPQLTPVGDKMREKDEVIDVALKNLNGNHSAIKQYKENDFLYGFSREEKTYGTQYEMYFQTGTENIFQHVTIFRPFAPLQTVVTEIYDKQNEWINLIMPLQGRLEILEHFLTMFMNVVKRDNKIFFTVVYFGEEGKIEAKQMIETAAKAIDYKDFLFIEKNGNFSRGGGLLAGSQAWSRGNVLMYFCDVDIHFKIDFLQRCRLNSAPAAKVYYPIVFSMYNPELVYRNEPEIPKLEERFVIQRESGFWRTFGFGMVCIYRSDFIFNKGFDTNIQGWGWEDVQLYRRLIGSNLEVIRSPDAGIFHIWHEKSCDLNLPPKQYEMCLGSKAMADGSITQLGMLAYGHLKRREKDEEISDVIIV